MHKDCRGCLTGGEEASWVKVASWGLRFMPAASTCPSLSLHLTCIRRRGCFCPVVCFAAGGHLLLAGTAAGGDCRFANWLTICMYLFTSWQRRHCCLASVWTCRCQLKILNQSVNQSINQSISELISHTWALRGGWIWPGSEWDSWPALHPQLAHQLLFLPG